MRTSGTHDRIPRATRGGIELEWSDEGVALEDRDRRGGPAQKYGQGRQGDTQQSTHGDYHGHGEQQRHDGEVLTRRTGRKEGKDRGELVGTIREQNAEAGQEPFGRP
jgi:hypothetical protein